MPRLLALSFRLLVTLGMAAAAIVVGLALWDYYMEAPWTRDGRVRADVVGVAPDVSGLVTEVMVEDNQVVKRGDVLFRIELSDAAASQQRVEAAQAADLEAKAAYGQATADRDLAKLNLERSAVKASVNGRITNMELRPGTYVTTGRGVMALIDGDTLRVEGYFEETKLPRIHVGDRASIRLMGEAGMLTGHVESFAGGIEDRERTAGSNLLASVNPTFAWVRLAQRIPVRIKLDAVADEVRLVSGRTATVAVEPKGETPRLDMFGFWRRATSPPSPPGNGR
jgi:multidrug resistance efflux pump